MTAFCKERQVNKAYVITKDASDFGIIELGMDIHALKIPAPLACYWLGRSEASSAENYFTE
ncbi:MAG: hypothetical protein ACOYOE_13610 [Chlorobium sp.]